jgi:hypothetical protein
MALRDVILATQADLRANADHAIATFSADSRQVEGLRSETKIRQFSLTVDEPPTLGGTDTGPNPVELVLRRWPRARKSLIAPMPPRSASRWRASQSSWTACSICAASSR